MRHVLPRWNLHNQAATARQVTVLLYLLIFVTAIVQTAIVPLLPDLARVYRLNPSSAAWLLVLPSVAMLLTSTPVGLLGDRIGARSVTLGAGVALCASAFAQAIPCYAIIFVGRLVFGVAFGAVWTTGLAWLGQVQEGDASRRLGATVTAAAVGTALGPALSGVLASHVGLEAPFIGCGVAVGIVTTLLLCTPATGRGRTPPTASTSMRRVSHQTRRLPGVAAGAGALAVSGAVGSAVQLLVPLQLNRAGASAAEIGLALSSAAVVFIAVSGLVVRLGPRLVNLRVNAWTSVLLTGALIPGAVSTSSTWLVGMLFLTALPRATVGTIAYPLATRHAQAGGLGAGAVIGQLNDVWAAAMVFAPLAGGLISQFLGFRAAYVAIIILGAAIAVTLLKAQSRHTAVTDTTPVTTHETAHPETGNLAAPRR